MPFQIHKLHKEDQPAVSEIMQQYWGDNFIVVHGDIFQSADMQGIKAVEESQIVGILHYQVLNDECEILTLASLREGQGIGTALLCAVESIAQAQGCLIMSVITTNDNLHALGFYQKHGFRLAALFPGQVEISRKIKPSIPDIGDHQIPIRDEIRLEKSLQ